MRYINQIVLSKCLKGRRNNPPETTVAAKRAWRRSNKKDIRKSCYKQQFGLCAYTEISLDNEDLGCHLEHIAPRSSYPERTFLPDNIILSIMSDVESGNLLPDEKFGGHHKSETYSEDWFISPFDKNCGDYFEYTKDGLTQAASHLSEQRKLSAQRTIDVLNLNAAYLVDNRRACLVILNEKIVELVSENYDESFQIKLNALAIDELQLRDRKLPEFYSAKKQLIASYASL